MRVKIVIFTANETRHLAFIDYLSKHSEIKILRSYIEKRKILKDHKIKTPLKKYFNIRNTNEKKYFPRANLKKKKYYNYGYISTDKCYKEIIKLKPNLIIVYGSSILQGKILKKFKKKILNVHLGLSPYYRGSGTNVFPIINNEPEYVGVTFMYLNQGVDTGEIIHQIRPDICVEDSIHDIGNKLILKMFSYYKKLILNYKKIKLQKKIYSKKNYYYMQKDFNEIILKRLKKCFKKGVIKDYLKNKNRRDKKVTLTTQRWI